MMLRRFQKAGHRPIAIVGGATGMIGDPSGKSAERNLLDEDQLNANIAGIEVQMRHLLDFESGETSAVLVNNNDWMKEFSYTAFLRDVGKNFPVNVMLGKDSVKSRLSSEAGLSYTEFSYMLLQAYDFVRLNQDYDCELQIGGSDQWGNVTAGIDLGRRMLQKQLYGITCPLLTKSDGAKMGKTESGAIWLSAERTSPYQFYQYWFNVDDNDVDMCLKFLTELSEEEIQSLASARNEDASKRDSQRRLAEEVTKLIHGESGLETAMLATNIFFGKKIENCNDAGLLQIFADVPSAEYSKADFERDGLGLLDAFVQVGLSKSKGEARRTVQQGGANVNNNRVEDIDHKLTTADLASESVVVLRSGKKKFALLKLI
jgi:tyrosyl-tRNA synthetase